MCGIRWACERICVKNNDISFTCSKLQQNQTKPRKIPHTIKKDTAKKTFHSPKKAYTKLLAYYLCHKCVFIGEIKFGINDKKRMDDITFVGENMVCETIDWNHCIIVIFSLPH